MQKWLERFKEVVGPKKFIEVNAVKKEADDKAKREESKKKMGQKNRAK